MVTRTENNRKLEIWRLVDISTVEGNFSHKQYGYGGKHSDKHRQINDRSTEQESGTARSQLLQSGRIFVQS